MCQSLVRHKQQELVLCQLILVLKILPNLWSSTTVDFMFALMSNEELEALGQMKVKQLKNRYNDPSINRAFIIGVDRLKMRLYDVQQASQNIVDANQTDEKRRRLQ